MRRRHRPHAGPRRAAGADGRGRPLLPLLGGVDRPHGQGRPPRPQRADPGRPRRGSTSCAPRRRRARWPTTRARCIAVPPLVPPPGVLNHLTVAAFNEFWFRKAPQRRVGADHVDPRRTSTRSTPSARGTACTAAGASCSTSSSCRSARRRRCGRSSSGCAASGTASFLAVLKRFGAANPGPLSFPRPRLDPRPRPARPAPRAWPALLHGLDDLVLEAGGRHYLAKDGHTTPAAIRRGYPRLDEWRAVRAGVDPGRRVGQRPEPAPAPARGLSGAPRTEDDGRRHMENALGEPQTIVLLGGTSDIGRAIVAALIVAVDPHGRPGRPPTRTRWRSGDLERPGLTVDVVPFEATDTRRPRGVRRRPGRPPRRPRRRDRRLRAARRPGRAGRRPGRRGRAGHRQLHGRGRASAWPSPRSSGARATAGWSCCPAWPASGCARPTSSTARRRPASTASPRVSATRWPGRGPACSSCGRASSTRR